jgi:formate hydrogenlyase subunit 6/NADH:ubiquinone oxidoreductase subunit I
MTKKTGRMLPEALHSLLKKPATTGYPFVKAERPDHYRGRLVFDASKCIGCRLCMRDCPSNAIEIVKVGEKQFRAIVRLDKCIYCAQCCDSCVKGALSTTKEFELANFKRDALKVDITTQQDNDGAE